MGINNLLQIYRDEFNWLIDTALSGYLAKPIRHPAPKYALYLYKQIQELVEIYDLSRALSREDLEQEVKLTWLEAEEAYRRKERPISLKWFLIKCGSRRLVKLIERSLSIPEREGKHLITYYYMKDSEPQFDIGIQFLFLGSDIKPLNRLTPFERYLIYLRFNLENSIEEIAVRLHRHSDSIETYLEELLAKLRKEYDKEAPNTARSY